MYKRVRDLMQWRADLLSDERFDDLAREYVMPFVLYKDSVQIVVHRHEEMVALFTQLKANYRNRGIVRLLANVTAIDLPRNGRLRVWLSYCELDAQDSVVSQSHVVHYCCETPMGLKTEMADYEHCALVGIWEQDDITMAQSN